MKKILISVLFIVFNATGLYFANGQSHFHDFTMACHLVGLFFGIIMLIIAVWLWRH
jgi:hypothetical protein